MSIVLEGLTKRYAGHAVVSNLGLEVGDGEFFVLLGSSGSGKTTVLRLVAGLTEPDAGRVILRGRDVTRDPPQRRNAGFVFQHYALFEHMSVADNVCFGLRIRKASKSERRDRCAELLDMVGLAGLGERRPSQLSGGQRQRVALARALAHRPDVLLLDEPLGALDAKIRAELRTTLKRIQTELRITTILVTHDQVEAFELADRLGVMSFGRLLEVGLPAELYERPRTEFVATFLGTANLLVGEHSEDGIRLGRRWLRTRRSQEVGATGRLVQVLFRPEDVVLAATEDGLEGTPVGCCEVAERTYRGSHERLRLRLEESGGARQLSPRVAFGQDLAVIEVTRSSEDAQVLPLELGSPVWLGVRRLHLLEHPGMRLAVVYEDTPWGKAAAALGGYLARHAHARLVLVDVAAAPGSRAGRGEGAIALMGGGLRLMAVRKTDAPLQVLAEEDEADMLDLAVVGAPLDSRGAVAGRLLDAGMRNILVVCREQPEVTHALVCLGGGEPGQADIGFAGRLLRHVGARATLLTVVPREPEAGEDRRRRRFLENAVKQLEGLGVPARVRTRRGDVASEVAAELASDGYDLAVIGTPPPGAGGKIAFRGHGPDILARASCPILVVRYDSGHSMVSSGVSGQLDH